MKGTFAIILIIFMSLAGYFLYGPYNTYKDLMTNPERQADFPEEMQVSDDVVLLMRKIFQQTATLFRSSELFRSHIEMESASLNVSSHARVGTVPYQSAVMDVPCESKEQLFEFMTGLDGHVLIDPVTPKEEHSRPSLLYRGASNGQSINFREAVMSIGHAKRLFVVANVLDRENLVFSSQSVAFPYDKYPTQPSDGPIKNLSDEERSIPRAYNTFALQVMSSSESSDGTCRMQLMNAITGLPLIPDFMLYLSNAKTYFSGIHRDLSLRMRDHLKDASKSKIIRVEPSTMNEADSAMKIGKMSQPEAIEEVIQADDSEGKTNDAMDGASGEL